jgi:hypothetical protein
VVIIKTKIAHTAHFVNNEDLTLTSFPKNTICRTISNGIIDFFFRIFGKLGDLNISQVTDMEYRWADFLADTTQDAITEFNHR